MTRIFTAMLAALSTLLASREELPDIIRWG